MPCDSAYLEPNHREKDGSKVLALLDELRTGTLDKKLYGSGYQGFNPGFGTGIYYDGNLDTDVAALCTLLGAENFLNIAEYSLEMQMWWRDHQEADKIRISREIQKAANDHDKAEALAKLSPHEKKLLGLG